MRLLRAADYPAVPWRNGGGVTQEIAAAPAPGGEGLLWRLSLATIAADGPFSCFPGIDRTLTLVEGAIRLGGVALDDRSEPFRFAGEATLDCTLLEPRPALALNIMTLRGAWEHAAERISSEVERVVMPPETGAVLLFACGDELEANDYKLSRRDMLQLLPGDAPVVVARKGRAQAVLVTIRAALE